MSRYQEGDIVSYKYCKDKEFIVTGVFTGYYTEYKIISLDEPPLEETRWAQASNLKLIKRNPFNMEPSEKSVLNLL